MPFLICAPHPEFLRPPSTDRLRCGRRFIRVGGDAAHGPGRVRRRAAQAGAGRLLLTHLLPGTDPAAAQDAAASHYTGHIGVAASGLVLDLP